MVKINGNSENADGKILMDYLNENGYRCDRVAVECNAQIVPKNTYGEKILEEGDEIEIVSFVGGG